MEPLVFTFTEQMGHSPAGRPCPVVTIHHKGQQLGDPLNDSSNEADGYRYHDVFHMGVFAKTGGKALVMHLFLETGQHIVPTGQLIQQNISIPRYDEDTQLSDTIEITRTNTPETEQLLVNEEALSMLSFNDAKRRAFYQNGHSPSSWLLNRLTDIAAGTPLALSRTDWRQTLKETYDIFTQLNENRGGTVLVDPEQKTIRYIAPVGA